MIFSSKNCFFYRKNPHKRDGYADFSNPIIPYQEQLGNYNYESQLVERKLIIPYQEQLGNYNYKNVCIPMIDIIPYQEQLGNYNL